MEDKKSFGSIVLSLITWLLIVLLTINFVRLFVHDNFDFKYDFMSINSFVELSNNFIEILDIESFFTALSDAFTFSNVSLESLVNTPISQLIGNTLSDIGEIILLPIQLILLLARFIGCIFYFISTFFMYNV